MAKAKISPPAEPPAKPEDDPPEAWPAPRPKRKYTVAEGLRFHTLAERQRLRADGSEARGDIMGARWNHKDAEVLQDKADTALATSPTDEIADRPGGEVVSKELAWDAGLSGVYDRLIEAPAYLGCEAALDRLEHAPNGTIAMAVDAVNSMKVQNSLAIMLCYQMASAHHTSQRMAELADQFASEAERAMNYGGNVARAQAATVEATRCANAQARSSDAFQKGMLTLDRLRNGGRQHVTVQHVQVQDGGQAVGQARWGGAQGRGPRPMSGRPHALCCWPTGIYAANAATRCGALARRTAVACCQPAMVNGRCRMHGGASTGPRTLEGRAAIRAIHLKHGGRSNASVEAARARGALRRQLRELLEVMGMLDSGEPVPEWLEQLLCR